MERVGSTPAVRLILYAKKQDTYLSPSDMVELLSNVDVYRLSYHLGLVLDNPIQTYGIIWHFFFT